MANYTQTASLDCLIASEPAIAYKRVRQANKGLRTNYIPTIIIIGTFDGIGGADIARGLKITQPSAFRHLGLAIGLGFVRKLATLYYLTDNGRKVYNDALKESRTLRTKLVAEATRRARLAISRDK